MRTHITPGRLYASMSAEFKRLRPQSCQWCRLPLAHLTRAESEDSPNWMLSDLPSGCPTCTPVIMDIMRRYQERFQLLDPLAMPLRPLQSPPGAGTSMR